MRCLFLCYCPFHFILCRQKKIHTNINGKDVKHFSVEKNMSKLLSVATFQTVCVRLFATALSIARAAICNCPFCPRPLLFACGHNGKSTWMETQKQLTQRETEKTLSSASTMWHQFHAHKLYNGADDWHLFIYLFLIIMSLLNPVFFATTFFYVAWNCINENERWLCMNERDF